MSVYIDILDGKRRRFPDGTWDPVENGKENLKALLLYLFEERLDWTKQEVLQNFNKIFFVKWKVRGGTQKLFNDSPYEILRYVYPDWDIKPWELTRAGNKTWEKKEDIKQAIRWLVFDKMKWNKEQICSDFNLKVLEENGLIGALTKYREYNETGEIYELITYCIPEFNFKADDFEHLNRWYERQYRFGKKFNDDEILEIRNLDKKGVPTKIIAEKFDVTASAIRRIVTHTTYGNVK
ncbi:hypothetical protein J2W97_001294 [Paenibacillus jamilae]|nr:hypothetical protein [Paenibacillus jamilae]